jgi:hypothetical protein
MQHIAKDGLRIARISVVISALLLLSVLPTEFLNIVPSICLFKNLFGIECFGCGMTRAISSMLHLNFSEAISYNRLVIIVLPAAFIFLVKDSLSFFYRSSFSKVSSGEVHKDNNNGS